MVKIDKIVRQINLKLRSLPFNTNRRRISTEKKMSQLPKKLMDQLSKKLNFRLLLGGLVALVFTSIAIETCSGQILFRRRRERMKAEMKWELQQQLNANLDSQVESARNDLSKSASEQIQQEAAELRSSIKREIIAMRAEADKIVAEEKKRIAIESAAQISQIKMAADNQIARAKKELKASSMDSLAKAEGELKKALDNYSDVLGNQNKESFVKFEEQTSKKFDSLKGEMVKLINKDVASEVQTAIKKRIAASNKRMENRVKKLIEQALAKQQKQPKKPRDKKKKAEGDKKAVLNRIPRVTESAGDEGDA